jgi:hypothetical protein
MMRIITEIAVTAWVATMTELTTITEIKTIARTRFGATQTVVMATGTGTKSQCVVAGRVQIDAVM